MGAGVSYGRMFSAYSRMQTAINSLIGVIGSQSVGGVQMADMFHLQMHMNQLTTFGQTITNVIQGIQEVAMGVARNAKGT